MPIRFRCVYCNKLLGIAKRKAGAVVNCPQCGQKLIVPTPEPEQEIEEELVEDQDQVLEEESPDVEPVEPVEQPPDPPAKPPSVAKPPVESKAAVAPRPSPSGHLFEQSDFEAILNREGSTLRAERPRNPPPVPAPPVRHVYPEVETYIPPPAPLPPPREVVAPPRPGIYLSPGKVTLFSILFVLFVGLAFGGGILVGRMMMKSAG